MEEVNTGPLGLVPGVNCHSFAFIGSQVVGGATETSDIDIAVRIIEGGDPAELFNELLHCGASEVVISDGEGGYEVNDDGMTSCKAWVGDTVWNYLIFTDVEYFDRFVDATTIAKRFGVVDKPLRVELFRLLCDGRRINGGYFEHIKIHSAEPENPF
ncbi:aminoglycoside nucleotidyltransferase [Pseudomonas phage DDSR119]|nr:aminoglycoside nucleotidyltransferase [Pseudomonas phage DDSR119]